MACRRCGGKKSKPSSLPSIPTLSIPESNTVRDVEVIPQQDVLLNAKLLFAGNSYFMSQAEADLLKQSGIRVWTSS